MKVIARTKDNDIATVFVAENETGKMFEFVESTQPPLTRRDKWVLIISTLFGCPVECTFCDAGGRYEGKLSYEELKFQIDYLINIRFPSGYIDSNKFKIQFARMGEPSFNPAVLELLRNIPALYDYRLFLPSLSTIAPAGTDNFFEELLQLKKELYRNTFQLQFSLHSSDTKQRDELLPVKKWSFEKIAKYSERFYDKGGKKITLNFALSQDSLFEPKQLLKYFAPEIFLLKITPINPTYKAEKNNIKSLITEKNNHNEIVKAAEAAGYGVILSIGEWEENKIGSNCGQYVSTLQQATNVENAYEYELSKL